VWAEVNGDGCRNGAADAVDVDAVVETDVVASAAKDVPSMAD